MPVAIDTNVLIRALVDDGTDQTRRSLDRFSTGRIFVPGSVLLEAEWVLRSSLKFTRSSVNALLSGLVGLDQVEFEDRAITVRAIAAHREGMDFADAIHLFASSHCEALYSFDDDFRRKATKMDDAIAVLAP